MNEKNKIGAQSLGASKKYETYLSSVNIFFNCIIILSFIASIVLAVYAYLNTPTGFNNYIQTFFNEHIFLGDSLFSFLKNSGHIDFNYLINTYIQPVAIVDILILFGPFLLVQLCVFFFKRHFLKVPHAVYSVTFSVLLLLAMLFSLQGPFSFLSSIIGFDLQIRTVLLTVFLILQLFIMGVMIYCLYKLERIKLGDFVTHKIGSRLVRTGAIGAFIVLLLLGTGLTVLNAKVNDLKEAVTIEYTIDMTKVLEGKVQLDIPPKVTRLSQLVGINLPTEINEVTILNQFGLSTIDVGSIVNSYTIPQIEKVQSNWLLDPLYKVAIGLVIALGFLVSEFIAKRSKNNPYIWYYLQGVVIIIQFMVLSRYLTTILLFFYYIIIIGILMHIGRHLTDIGVFATLKEKIQKKIK